MERHQAGQEETLVEVRVEVDSLEVAHQPRGSPADLRGCFKCVVALETLVIVALLAGFLLLFFKFTPSCNQDSPPLSDTAKVNISCKLKKSDVQGRYDIFTAEKAATYLIYGWVKFSDDTSKEVTVVQTWKTNDRTLKTETETETEMFFFIKVKLVDTSRISLYFKSTHTDDSFHVYEL